MKLLLVASFSESIIRFRGELIDRMLEIGIEVHVACPDINFSVRNRLIDKGVVLHEIPLNRAGINPLRDIYTFYSLIKIIRKIKPDILFCYTVKPVIYGMLAASLNNVPSSCALITGLGYAFTGPVTGSKQFIRFVILHLYKIALSRSTIVFFQNTDDADLFIKLGVIGSTSFRIVNGSGVNTGYYVPSAFPARPVFLLVARLLGDKGVREFVEAARFVKKIYPFAQFDLVGWIDENPDAISKQELDLWCDSGLINYRGKLLDVRPAIASSSVYVLPSYREGTPRSVLEAMAMGRPIITTDAPGCRETVVDGDNGFLVPVKSAELLATAMLKFIEHPELISRMGKRSRQISEEKYDVNKVNDYILTEMRVK